MLKRRILSVLLVLAMLVPFAGAAQTAQDNMRGVWVASVANIDYPSSAGMTAQALAAEADTMLDNIAAMDLNTVFLQVRPSADALYRSALFPQSRYVSGTCGASPDGDFDVLAYWVEGAHERGLQLHAWINPYRITRNGKEELDALPESSPARQHPEWVVEYDGNYYFNPGLPAVQQLVMDGAAEIVRNYDVDGLHLDDYFYPGTDFNDAETFARYGADFSSIDNWRRDNVNTLIASLDETLHTLDPELSFGVSPAGIWANKSENPRGSNTHGQSSYSELYCDSLEWIRRGTVDYICPQLCLARAHCRLPGHADRALQDKGCRASHAPGHERAGRLHPAAGYSAEHALDTHRKSFRLIFRRCFPWSSFFPVNMRSATATSTTAASQSRPFSGA